MRVLAYALVALSLGSVTAAAQNYGPGPYGDDDRSGPPPRYYSDRPRYDGPRSEPERLRYDNERPGYYTGRPPSRVDRGYDRPPYRGAPDDHGGPRPSSYIVRERPPEPSYRRGGPSNGSEAYRRFWDDGDGRNSRTVVRSGPAPRDFPPPPARSAERRGPPPVSGPPPRLRPRVAETSGRMTVSVAEFRDLQNRVRELERILERRDFRDERPSGPRTIYR